MSEEECRAMFSYVRIDDDYQPPVRLNFEPAPWWRRIIPDWEDVAYFFAIWMCLFVLALIFGR